MLVVLRFQLVMTEIVGLPIWSSQYMHSGGGSSMTPTGEIWLRCAQSRRRKGVTQGRLAGSPPRAAPLCAPLDGGIQSINECPGRANPNAASAAVPSEVGGVPSATVVVSIEEGSGTECAACTGAEPDGGGSPEMAGVVFGENPAVHNGSGRNAGLVAAAAKRRRGMSRGIPFTARRL